MQGVMIGALFVIAALHGAAVRTPMGDAPRIDGVDTASRSIVVRNTPRGSLVTVFVNGFRVATAPGRAGSTRVRLSYALRPGSAVVAMVDASGRRSYTLRPATVWSDYVTYHYDEGRTGWNPYETTLTTADVASRQFGPKFSVQVDADVIAQPLYAQAVDIPGLGTHDVLYVATENDSLYAFDADNGAPLWVQSYVNPAAWITAVPASDLGSPPVGCYQYSQTTVGITSTPVIDRSTSTIYFDTFVKQTQPVVAWHHYLHAVDMTTGLDEAGSPIDVQARYRTPGGQIIPFIPLDQANRPALLEDDGTVYVAYGSQCDAKPRKSFGWMFAFATNPLGIRGVYNASPDVGNGLASFWMSGFGPAGGDGYVYAATGNGIFNANQGGADYGDAILKLTPAMSVADYFEPWQEIGLDPPDSDLGSGGVMLLPLQAGAVPNLLVAAGKDRTLYLLNRNALGDYVPGGPDASVQDVPGAIGARAGIWGGPAYYVNPGGTPLVYYSGSDDYLKAWALETSPATQLLAAMESSRIVPGRGGSIPVVSSNGEAPGSAIVWLALRPPSAQNQTVGLEAYDANQLATRLYHHAVGTFDNPQTYFFAVPTVINGKVYVSTGRSVVAFGL